MMKHTELINLVAEKIGAKTYLEIGVYDRAHNFDRIRVDLKLGVDPAIVDHDILQITSDEYFKDWVKGPADNYDLIFIDGLHHADQVRKDIINSWKVLTDGGCIILHDTNPHSEKITHIPRDNREWCGDVFKAVCQVQNDKFTLKDDYGVTVIRKQGELKMNSDAVTWDEFDLFRTDFLNLKTWEESIEIIDSWK